MSLQCTTVVHVQPVLLYQIHNDLDNQPSKPEVVLRVQICFLSGENCRKGKKRASSRFPSLGWASCCRQVKLLHPREGTDCNTEMLPKSSKHSQKGRWGGGGSVLENHYSEPRVEELRKGSIFLLNAPKKYEWKDEKKPPIILGTENVLENEEKRKVAARQANLI